ncbi:MAG: hypothetical protein GF330_01820, partial [Candidatus Eisenbacteria bacterium]|nr:hypothetical protein [Candidatus Eisenbacteria bacterium]
MHARTSSGALQILAHRSPLLARLAQGAAVASLLLAAAGSFAAPGAAMTGATMTGATASGAAMAAAALVRAAAIGDTPTQSPQLPILFEMIDYHAVAPGSDPHCWTVTDLERDGTADVIFVADRHKLLCRTLNGSRWTDRWERTVSHPGLDPRYARVAAIRDLDGDRLRDLAFVRASGDTLRLDLMIGESTHTLATHVCRETKGDGVRDGRLFPLRVIENVATGEPVLITVFLSGKDENWRGVVGHDLQTGEEVWSFETGSNPNQGYVRFVDLDGEVGEEILFGMPSPGNRGWRNTTTDSSAWVMALRS